MYHQKMCVISYTLSRLTSTNDFPHYITSENNHTLCVRSCVTSLHNHVNDFPQESQVHGFIHVCAFFRAL